MRRTFTLQMHRRPPSDPCPSDEAWCCYCGAPIGLGMDWRDHQDRTGASTHALQAGHSLYCTRNGAPVRTGLKTSPP